MLLLTQVQRVVVTRVVATAAASTPHLAIASVARNHTSSSQENKLKVAIVGGGPAGLSAALHLAPLVSSGIIEAPIDVYEGKPSCVDTQEKRETIGVGLWSTALVPFLRFHAGEHRPSYKMLIQQLVSVGCFVTNVGYRTSNGSWITQTTLPSNNLAKNNENIDIQQPSLLFLQRHSLLKSLYDAIFIEEQQTVKIHYGHKIQSIKQCDRDYEATLSYGKGEHEASNGKSTRPYNLIIVAEGMNSNLRRRYSTHTSDTSTELHNDAKQDTRISSTFACNYDIEDRGYFVFRANTTVNSGTITESFQTWGENNSMRFAVVPCYMLPYSSSTSTTNHRPLGSALTEAVLAPQHADNLQPIQGYTWFFTTNDPWYNYANINSPTDRKDRILESLRHWHDPIYELIQSTRAEDIVMERAMAHRSLASALGARFERENRVSQLPPLVCFIGDSDMTVDPVLAQGITIGMEDASYVAKCIEHASLVTEHRRLLEVVKEELIQRHQRKKQGRLKCLLNATNLVQGLAQPSNMVSELGNRFVVRPITTHVVPEFIKSNCFHWVMNYSLGLSKKNTL